MVDPNPGRGMPLQLQRYWLAGKGGAKIRWGMPHDFDRCVRQLRKHFPTNPEGLCNILHQKALGAPPGKGHPGAHSAFSVANPNWIKGQFYQRSTGIQIVDHEGLIAAQALIAKQPKLGKYVWTGPIAPIGRPTQEPRQTRLFEPGALRHRMPPLPLDWREHDAPGHAGSLTIGRMLGITYGPDHQGLEYAWAWGDYLDEEIIPEAKKARHLMEMGVAGGSVDPGGRVVGTVHPETGVTHMSEFTIGRVTLVPIPAFSGTRLYVMSEDGDWPDDDMDMVMEGMPDDDDCGCADTSGAILASGASFTVNSSGWRGLPLAPRDSVFDNDDAVKRIAAWASVAPQGTNVDMLRRAFMWYDPNLPPTDPTSYRLPVGDIINGELTLIYHAIYAAAALLSGAHGGLPGIDENDRGQLRNIISEIYPEMAREFNDSSILAPWDRSSQPGVQMSSDNEYSATTYPVEPPKEWFRNPGLPSKTPLTVEPSGQVFGHIAAWGECHRDFAGRECVLAPRSRKGYEPFHLGTVYTAEGDSVRVGKIVMDTRHADIGLGYTAAAVHYDNTGDEIAVVRAGEDEFGVWVAGAVVPEATPARVAKLRRSPISGDWRRVEGNLELTAALAVNVPAFPVYAMDGEEQLALVAAGTLDPEEFEEPPTGIAPDPDLGAMIRAVVTEVFDSIAEAEGQQDRATRLSDIMEDEDIYAQRARMGRFSALTAAAQPPEPAPTPTQPPQAPGEQAPAPTPGVTWPPDDQTLLAMQMDARFSIIEEPAGDQPEGADRQTAPVGTTPPATPAPIPQAPVQG